MSHPQTQPVTEPPQPPLLKRRDTVNPEHARKQWGHSVPSQCVLISSAITYVSLCRFTLEDTLSKHRT